MAVWRGKDRQAIGGRQRFDGHSTFNLRPSTFDGRAATPSAALAVAEALQLLDERGAANLGQGGGAVLVAAGLFQRFCDELALHLLERRVEVHAVRADGRRRTGGGGHSGRRLSYRL